MYHSTKGAHMLTFAGSGWLLELCGLDDLSPKQLLRRWSSVMHCAVALACKKVSGKVSWLRNNTRNKVEGKREHRVAVVHLQRRLLPSEMVEGGGKWGMQPCGTRRDVVMR